MQPQKVPAYDPIMETIIPVEDGSYIDLGVRLLPRSTRGGAVDGFDFLPGSASSTPDLTPNPHANRTRTPQPQPPPARQHAAAVPPHGHDALAGQYDGSAAGGRVVVLPGRFRVSPPPWDKRIGGDGDIFRRSDTACLFILGFLFFFSLQECTPKFFAQFSVIQNGCYGAGLF